MNQDLTKYSLITKLCTDVELNTDYLFERIIDTFTDEYKLLTEKSAILFDSGDYKIIIIKKECE